jgi:hypothetical protein
MSRQGRKHAQGASFVIEYPVLLGLRPFEVPTIECPVIVTADARAARRERRKAGAYAELYIQSVSSLGR